MSAGISHSSEAFKLAYDLLKIERPDLKEMWLLELSEYDDKTPIGYSVNRILIRDNGQVINKKETSNHILCDLSGHLYEISVTNGYIDSPICKIPLVAGYCHQVLMGQRVVTITLTRVLSNN